MKLYPVESGEHVEAFKQEDDTLRFLSSVEERKGGESRDTCKREAGS